MFRYKGVNNSGLVNHLIKSGYLEEPRIIEAFRKVDRKDFVPGSFVEDAYIDRPLPIGKGQTISQPAVVAFMLELLKPKPAQKVMDIGAGSGWTSALLSVLVGDEGEVFAYEIVEEVGDFGRKNVKNFHNVEYRVEDYRDYLQKDAPYDRILSGAAFSHIPQDLVDSLTENGVLVVPTANNDIRKIVKKGENIEEEIYPGFVFVPITKRSDIA